MDLNRLTVAEKRRAGHHHGFFLHGTLIPNNVDQMLANVNVVPGASVAVELIDLYIATQLFQDGLQIPPELTRAVITPDYYVQLAPVIYLPLEYTEENINRAERIIRIIRDMNKSTIQLMPLLYRGPNRIGDFGWMITRPEYDDVLFLFNDNESQFLQFVQLAPGMTIPGACSPGGGNAIVRPYQCQVPARAAGIPTGNQGGYRGLAQPKQLIDWAINRIKHLLSTGRYKRIAYSASEDGRTLGTGIFNVAPEVKEYIVSNLEALIK